MSGAGARPLRGVRAAALPMVGSWSSGKRWLMNCMVMAWKQEARVNTRPEATRAGPSVAPAGGWPDAGASGRRPCPGAFLPGSRAAGGGRHLPLLPTPPAPSITSLYSREKPPAPGRAPHSMVAGRRPRPAAQGGDARRRLTSLRCGTLRPCDTSRFPGVRTQRRRGSLRSAAPAQRGGGARAGGVPSRPRPGARAPPRPRPPPAPWARGGRAARSARVLRSARPRH